ncbi:MAG: sulfatase-like hydrolase/transferase [Lentisphaerae bacterium]|nr:sulfatase-like hydrolase/transferase [Lentisphaerota bacterium]
MSVKPNILYIMTDQWNAECFSGLNHPDVKTPNIDQLIEKGVCFRNCFAAEPICQPSRVSYLTGQYVHTHRVMRNHEASTPQSVNTPLPGYLKEKAGYRTGAFGKLHLGVFEKDAGFDSIAHCCDNPFGKPAYYEYLEEKGLLDIYMEKEKKMSQETTQRFAAGKSGLKAADCNETWTADQTIDFISESSDPFFVWCSFERPHAPHTPPEDAPVKYDPEKLTIPPYDPKWFDSKAMHARAGCENLWKAWVLGEDALREGLAGYYGLMSLIDQQVGRIIDHLEQTGKLDNTIIVFCADHGDFGGYHGMLGKNSSTYDSIMRVPYVWYWKGHTDRNMHFDLCETIDMYPTLCDLAGLETPPSVQGKSHVSALTDLPYYPGKDYVFFERLLAKGVRSRTHKLSVIPNGRNNYWELYDILEDPDELKNRYGDPQLAHVQTRLMEELVAWSIKTEQPCHVSNSSEEVTEDLRWHSHFLDNK